MNIDNFKAAYNASRNGTDGFHFNPLYPRFRYSDGVRECAEAGCYWLLDILGTELAQHISDRDGVFCIVAVTVSNGKAQIKGELEDDDPEPFIREIEWTDMPEGKWTFYVDSDAPHFHCILPSEY